MASTAGSPVGRRLGVLAAGAVVVTSLTVASAGAATSAPLGMQAAWPTRPGADASPDRRAGAPPPGFLLERGRFTTFTVPGAQITLAYGINDRGQIVGHSVNDLTVTAVSGFLRDARGRITAINRPDATVTAPFDINNRGQIVGVAGTPDPAPSPPPTDPAPMGRMA
jgi:hypothetical protein